MSEIRVETTYINTSCNRHIHCLDWIATDRELVCFAAKNAIAIYDVEKFRIINLLVGHNDHVNCARWILPSGESFPLIISTSNDKTAIIWQCIDNKDDLSFTIKHKLVGHTGAVMMGHSITHKDDMLSLTCSNDKSIRFWTNNTQTAQLDVDNFVFDAKIVNHSDLFFPNVVIAFAGADEMVHLYSLEDNFSVFQPLINLKGHEDWIKSIDITFKNDCLMIASSSQDNFIRIHKIESTQKEEIAINEKSFTIGGEEMKRKFVVKLDTVLAGHEHWVNQVRWCNQKGEPLLLLSASMDKTMMLWEEAESEDDLWCEKVRVGEIGGNSLGFLGCAISPDGNSLIGYSFNGAFHQWKQVNSRWEPVVTLSGHFDQVSDLDWDPKGEFLLSCSFDETTRLHAQWAAYSSWHEIARPQIHGYELNCIAMIDRHTFVSGADEKVLRIFKATKCFAESILMITDLSLPDPTDADDQLAHCASVPPLGLSNQAIYELDQIDHAFKPTSYEEPPTEEMLLQNTLWPETQKLYGHGYELFAVAVNHAGTLIASSCKASKSEHANVILWSVKEGKQIASLESHQLTVTMIRFSHNDKYILSVSRDRSWSLYEAKDSPKTTCEYSRIALSDKKTGVHSRILWDCAFTPDDEYFITVARDKTAVFWQINANTSSDESANASCLGSVKSIGNILKEDDSIMTVDVAGTLIDNRNYLIAIGLENGNACLYKWNTINNWTKLYNIDRCHHLPMKRLRFSPKTVEQNNGSKQVMLASCGNDNIVKIHTIHL